MLGKLMKYEWKGTWKLLLPLNCLILVMGLLTYFTVQIDFFDSESGFVVFSGMTIIVFYVLSMIAVLVGTAIFLIYRFYTTVYGDQGYLLHTLPVDKHHIIIAKVLVSAMWLIISMVFIYSSLLLIGTTSVSFLELVWDVFTDVFALDDKNFVVGGLTVVMSVIAAIFGIFAKILKITACIALGQTSANHKVLSSFAIYYGIFFVQRLFTTLYYAVISISGLTSYDYSTALFRVNWEINLISSIVYCVIFYVITWNMMEKKLNLE